MRNRVLLYLFIASLMLVVSINDVLACSCPNKNMSATQAWKEVDVVITGTVTHIQPVRHNNTELITFNVLKSWKGGSGQMIKVTADTGDWSCDYIFSRGTSYLLFAKKDRNKRLRVSTCTPTATMESATNLIKELGTPEDTNAFKGQGSSSPYGTIYNDNYQVDPNKKRNHLQEYRSTMNPQQDYRQQYRPFSYDRVE